MFAKSNFRLTDAGITAIYTELHKIFDGNNKGKFTLWAQSVENAAKLCNMDTLTIALSKLWDPHLNQLASSNPKKLAQVSN